MKQLNQFLSLSINPIYSRLSENIVKYTMALSFPSAKHIPLLNYDELVFALEDEWIKTIHEDNYAPISGVTMDSRDVFFNEMFLAINGKNFQGVDFINTAYARGVKVFILAKKQLYKLKVLPEEVYERSCFLLVDNPITAYQLLAGHYLIGMGGFRIAVTGSAGKTTTKEMLTKTLRSAYWVFSTHKNENNHFGVPKNIFSLQRRLIGGEPISIMVFELGMNHSGEIDTLASIVKPHLAVITNILYAHIGNFNRREDIVSAKGEVIPHLSNHPNIYDGGVLVIPENIFGKESLISQAHNSSVKEVKTSVVTTSSLKYDRDKRSIVSQWIDIITDIKGEVPGFSIFMEEVLSLVLEVGEILGIPRQQSFSHLLKETSSQNNKSIESRLHIIDQAPSPLIIDDTYNANPDSVIQVVTALISLIYPSPPEFRLHVVLGDMLELGDFSESLHQICGEKIEEALSNLPSEHREKISFFFLGTEIKACYDNMKFPFKKHYELHYPSSPLSATSPIIEDLIKNCDSNSLVFFKASHGMRFDRLINVFLKSFMKLSSSSNPT